PAQPSRRRSPGCTSWKRPSRSTARSRRAARSVSSCPAWRRCSNPCSRRQPAEPVDVAWPSTGLRRAPSVAMRALRIVSAFRHAARHGPARAAVAAAATVHRETVALTALAVALALAIKAVLGVLSRIPLTALVLWLLLRLATGDERRK